MKASWVCRSPVATPARIAVGSDSTEVPLVRGQAATMLGERPSETIMLTPPVGQSDHALGGDRPLVTLVEFGDYECSFCGRAHPVLADALRRMPEEILFAFRHFPLAGMHPHATVAALAAEAAGAQGHFWPMHDILFENQ